MSDKEAGEPDIREAFWKAFPTLFGLHLAALALGLLVAGPLIALAVGRAVSTSGQAALSDTEILAFLMRPSGFLLALALITVWITFHLFAYAAQLVTARAALHGNETSLASVFGALVPHFPALASLTLRFLVRMMAIGLPFLAAIGGVAYVQLSNPANPDSKPVWPDFLRKLPPGAADAVSRN